MSLKFFEKVIVHEKNIYRKPLVNTYVKPAMANISSVPSFDVKQ